MDDNFLWLEDAYRATLGENGLAGEYVACIVQLRRGIVQFVAAVEHVTHKNLAAAQPATPVGAAV
jgi:hypothetical protein